MNRRYLLALATAASFAPLVASATPTPVPTADIGQAIEVVRVDLTFTNTQAEDFMAIVARSGMTADAYVAQFLISRLRLG